MKKISLLLVLVIVAAAAIVFTQRAENNSAERLKLRAIPELEAARLTRESNTRSDTGRLTPEALKQAQEIVSSRSTFFVMENVKANTVTLPITSERAKIAVFSPTDGSLDIQLSDPQGNELPVVPHSRNSSVEQDEISKLVRGRGNPADGVLLISDRKQTIPGEYTLNVRQASSPIDIIVNDEGGLELNVWFSDNGLDNNQSTTLNAKLMDGEAIVTGAKVNARVRGFDKKLAFTESAPGLYSATIDTTKYDGMVNFIIEAKGNRASGSRFLRHGNIELITGQSHAKLLGIGKEQLTETDLTVDVQIQVTAAGRYYLRGNLLSSTDEPIAWAQDARELTPGRHTLTLHFARQVIEQSGQTAGFKVSDIELMNTTVVPAIKATGKINDFFLKSSF
ncbi:MAG: hypothetical protein AB1489_01455 [Acidobacteriota bacterium]